MTGPLVHVETYSGYKADERPMRLHLGSRVHEIAAIEDRWYEPGATYYRVLVEGGDRYVHRHDDAQDTWTLAAFRASPPG